MDELFTPSMREELAEEATRMVEQFLAAKPRRGGGNQAQHSARVATTLAEGRYPWHVVIAGLLHDIVEDTCVTMEEIDKKFPVQITFLVDVLTKRGKGTKHERRYLMRIEGAGVNAVLIKLADNIDNLRGCQHLKRPAEYVRYSRKIQALGVSILGEEHPLVLTHLKVLRSVQASLVSMPG